MRRPPPWSFTLLLASAVATPPLLRTESRALCTIPLSHYRRHISSRPAPSLHHRDVGRWVAPVRRSCRRLFIGVEAAARETNNDASSPVVPLTEAIAEAMLRAKGPFIDSQELLSPDVAFRGAPLWEEQGGQNYLRSVEAWREALKGLPESSFAIDRISQTSPTTVICNWNVSFVPPSLLSFAALARSIPNVEVRYIDILHRIEFPVTGFTWQKLRYLLRCISKGFVPVAVAVGEEGTFNERWEDEKKKKSTVFNGPKSRAFERYALESEELAAARQNFQDRYDAVSNEVIDRVFESLSSPQPVASAASSVVVASERGGGGEGEGGGGGGGGGWLYISSTQGNEEGKEDRQERVVVSRQSEQIALVDAVREGRLKNRRIASDLLLYLDTRQPPSADVYEWDRIVRQNCDVTDVPGMNPLDVDGIDAETQGEFLQSSGIVLTFAATVMLVLGIGFAALYFAQMQQEIALREIMFDEELLSSSLKLS